MSVGQSDRVRLLEIAASVEGLAYWEVIPFAQALEAFVAGKPVPKYFVRFNSQDKLEEALDAEAFGDFPGADDKSH